MAKKSNSKAKSSKKSSNIFTRAAGKFSKMHKSAQILILALTVGIIGGGGFAVYNSYAAVPYLTSDQCYLLGRVYVGGAGNPCSSTCIKGAGSIVSSSPYNYCSGAVSKISSTTCSAKNRVWINNGCARRWQQTNRIGAYQCNPKAYTYIVTSTTDNCTADTSTSKFDCKITYNRTPSKGASTMFTLTVTNKGTQIAYWGTGIDNYIGPGAPGYALSPGQSWTSSLGATFKSTDTSERVYIHDFTKNTTACQMDWQI